MISSHSRNSTRTDLKFQQRTATLFLDGLWSTTIVNLNITKQKNHQTNLSPPPPRKKQTNKKRNTPITKQKNKTPNPHSPPKSKRTKEKTTMNLNEIVSQKNGDFPAFQLVMLLFREGKSTNKWLVTQQKNNAQQTYCWWKKSCISWCGEYPIIYRGLEFRHPRWCRISTINSITEH